jgi:hypothetical protein
MAWLAYSYTHDLEKTGYKGANKNSDFNTILGDAWKNSLTCKIRPSSSDVKSFIDVIGFRSYSRSYSPLSNGNYFLGCRSGGWNPGPKRTEKAARLGEKRYPEHWAGIFSMRD